MNDGNEKVGPKIDLQVGMEYSNRCILKTDSGAGANAVSKLGVRFVANNPLSELVWSPGKGLTIKYADSSFTEERRSLFWDVGPNNFFLDMTDSIFGVAPDSDRPIDGVCANPIAAVSIKSDVSGDDFLPKDLTSDSGANTECRECEEQDTGSKGNLEEMSSAETNSCDQLIASTAQAFEANKEKISTTSGHIDKMQFDNSLPQTDEHEPSMERNPLSTDQTSGGGDIEYKSMAAPRTRLTSPTRNHLENLESTAENDLQALKCDLVSKFKEIAHKSQDDKNMPGFHSPSNRKIRQFKRKRKEKESSDVDNNVKLSSKDKKDCHDSVESCCNSSGQVSTGKRLNFQKQLMVESNKIRKKTQEVSSNCLVREDGSFMSWISNMMKGFSLSIQEARSCLAHTLAYSDHTHEWPDQKLLTINRSTNPEQKSTGFQFIFESMYSPSLKRLVEDSRKIDKENKVHGIDDTSITFYPQNDIPYRQHLNLDEDDGKTSSSSLGGQNNDTEYHDSSALSEKKEVNNSCHRSDTLESQWISRFFPRSVAPLKMSDHLIHSGGTQEGSSNCSRLPPSCMNISHSNKCNIEENQRRKSADEAKESQNCSTNKEACDDTMDDEVNDRSMHKFTLLRRSQRFRNSEAMVSTFARRVDAIKYIISSNGTEKGSKGNMTCLFCGTKDNQLCDCSKISGTERPDLLKKLNSHVELEELPCSSNRFSQPNHKWTSRIMCTEGSREIPEFPRDDEGDQFISGCPKNDVTDSPPKRTLNFKRKLNEVLTSDKMWSNVSIKKYFGSMRPPTCFVERRISDVPEKIFSTVRKLRLSRTDILKWISSHKSLSLLDGFYLRLRLGEWEEGLGGTGYYVASINDTHKQNSQQDTRTSISVSVGGINCTVASRYISNQDFLEEEIIAWWSRNSKSGVGIPSEEDMIEKIKKKIMLGL